MEGCLVRKRAIGKVIPDPHRCVGAMPSAIEFRSVALRVQRFPPHVSAEQRAACGDEAVRRIRNWPPRERSGEELFERVMHGSSLPNEWAGGRPILRCFGDLIPDLAAGGSETAQPLAATELTRCRGRSYLA